MLLLPVSCCSVQSGGCGLRLSWFLQLTDTGAGVPHSALYLLQPPPPAVPLPAWPSPDAAVSADAPAAASQQLPSHGGQPAGPGGPCHTAGDGGSRCNDTRTEPSHSIMQCIADINSASQSICCALRHKIAAAGSMSPGWFPGSAVLCYHFQAAQESLHSDSCSIFTASTGACKGLVYAGALQGSNSYLVVVSSSTVVTSRRCSCAWYCSTQP